MFFEVAFSPLGLIVSVAALAPNLLLLWLPPHGGIPQTHMPRALGFLERAGQALCVTVPAVTAPGDILWWWLVPVLAALAGYYALWGRYLSVRDYPALYRPLWRVPAPMAILPVLVFLFASAWLANVWIGVAALIRAAGHIPVSLIVARESARQ